MLFFLISFSFCINNTNSGNQLTVKAHRMFSLYALFFIFIFFIGFRGYIYTDWNVYGKVFEETPSFFSIREKRDNFLKKHDSWNIGYLYFTIFCKTISSNYFVFQAISFIIDFIILYYFFKYYFIDIKLIFMSFVFFFLFGGVLGFGLEVNLMRNAKAMMCFLVSIRYIEKKKIQFFLFLNLLGFTFHTIALLFLPFYFILNKSFPRRLILLLFIIGNGIYLLHIQWLKEFLQFFNESIHTPFYSLIEVYLRMKKYSGEWGLSVGYIERTFSFLAVFLFEKRLLEHNKKNKIIINSFYIFIFIYLYCSEISIILNRVGLLFSFGYWILFPQIYFLTSGKRKKYFLLIFLIYGLLKCSTCNSLFFHYENALLPHKTYEQRYPLMKNFSNYLDDQL
ncbi:hypothetical protein Trebr_0440 [Treponema brennaborense DSM 12168]|uniref:EpsG family protein n=2 Tax=Treponema TaxID=157 RepID=F4LNN0_TREBD|nr:hypothetical protein Trebr_0440 [Treponema brennaborense DSM 12168]